MCVCLCLSVSLKGSTESKRPRFWEALKAFALHSSVPDQEQQQKPRSIIDTQTILLKLPPIPKPRTQARGMYAGLLFSIFSFVFQRPKSSPFGVSRFRKVTVHLSGRSLQQREISFPSNPQFHQVPAKQQQQQQQPHNLSTSLPLLIMRLHKFRSDN